MLLSRRIAQLGLTIALAVIPCLSASASLVAEKTTTLNGPVGGNVGQLTVHATVTKDASNLFTYTYDVSYNTGEAGVHVFGIENPNESAYSNAWNTPVDANVFLNPSYPSYIEWQGLGGSVLTVGNSRQFGYQSIYAPQEILVYCYAIDGGDPAEGWTLGMGNAVPEPGSMVALALGIAGLAPTVIRRRK